MKGEESFHIRALEYDMFYPVWKRAYANGNTIGKFKALGFLPAMISRKTRSEKEFEGFTYGDSRDNGFIYSCNNFHNGIQDRYKGLLGEDSIMSIDKKALISEQLEKLICSVGTEEPNGNDDAYSAIDRIRDWEHYLENPDDLE